jgi:ATP-binding cassette subfamily B protein
VTALGHADLALYRRLWRQARPYWPHITGVFLLSLLATPVALLTPLPLKIVVDSVLGPHPLPGVLRGLVPASESPSTASLLLLAAVLVIVVALVNQAQSLGVTVLSTYIGEKMVLRFRAELFRHVQRLSLAYHDTRGTADSAYRIQWDAPSIQYVTVDGVISFVGAACSLVGMMYVTARLDWQLALVAIMISPVLFALAGTYRRRLRRQSTQVKQLESSTLSVVTEVLGAARVVKAFGQEEREERRFVRQCGEGMAARLRLAMVDGGFTLFVSVATAVGLAAVMWIGARHVQAGILTLGDLVLIVGYISQLYTPLRTMSRKASSLQSHLASAERAFALLDEAPDVRERPGARALGRASGAVTFENVSFGYGRDRMVLHDVSFRVDPGTRLGIAGTTGAGKTTLASLLTRFYDPIAGRILLDGVDLRDYRLVDLRNQFAIVLQESVLFSTTIAENIAYARPGASDEEIVAAAKLANAHAFISRLPQGYGASVGQRGLLLSGGERQRIALARAFLKDAPILILDEPTSAIDMDTEAVIIEAMNRLMRGRTTFLIAHRLSTLQNCDAQLQIENGCLIASASGAWTPGTTSSAGSPTRAERC